MVVDFRRTRRDHSPLVINGSSVEIVKKIKFLGVHIAENLTWTLNTTSITKRAQQHLYFLRKLRKAHLPTPIFTTFYRGTVESILSSCIITWFGNCTVFDHKTLQRIVRTAEKIIGVSLPSITNIYITRCIQKATNIVKDPTHPSHELFTLLPSGRRCLRAVCDCADSIVSGSVLMICKLPKIEPQSRSQQRQRGVWSGRWGALTLESLVPALLLAFTADNSANPTLLALSLRSAFVQLTVCTQWLRLRLSHLKRRVTSIDDLAGTEQLAQTRVWSKGFFLAFVHSASAFLASICIAFSKGLASAWAHSMWAGGTKRVTSPRLESVNVDSSQSRLLMLLVHGPKSTA
ncbi:hypothetical protein P4O66_000370 [Electrophorus voltai]|uniref:Alkylated DNA repair protein AlkB homologue 8 N-terminal domain-containing protein n=1 Tax=Electrophorus voltai TaxID=2609070 RepID=A0AAD8ZK75_9TELE|nr:hypothetical protein P4O66_000370 [Electrophorus voltai]